MLDDMIKAMDKDVVAYMQFVQVYKKSNCKNFCFVEGKDDKAYYVVRLRELFNDEAPIMYSCGGKKGVIITKKLIENDKIKEENGNLIFYFVDKDYDLDDVPKDILKTEFYSIENYYMNFNMIKIVLSYYLEFDEESENYNLALSLYDRCYKRYSVFAKKLNIFLYSIREYEKIKNFQRVDFDQKKLEDFMENKDLVNLKFRDISYEELINEYNIQYEVPIGIFKRNEILFVENNHSNFRGKYEFQFLLFFLEKLRKYIKYEKNGFKKPLNASYDFRADPLKVLAPYAYTSDSLKEYVLRKKEMRTLKSLN